MKPKQDGFTLLEVIIAMAIMVIAFTAIYTSQSSSILLTVKTKDTNIAGFLAHNLMVESEHIMEGKPFSELKKTEEGSYPEPYGEYKWKREVKEIKFPDFSSAGSDKEEDKKDTTRMLTQAITKFLNNSIRELIVTVKWTRGGGERTFSLSTYLVDLNSQFDFSP